MAQVYQCDRCKMLASERHVVRDVDLCAACVTEFEAWVSSGPPRFKPSERELGRRTWRNHASTSMEVARVLADSNGQVSARSFAQATGEDFRSSYNRLAYLCRKGKIERVAGSVYRMPERSNGGNA